MSELLLSRITLRARDAREAFWSDLASLRDPHRLVWSFFPSDDAARRDFLFREESAGLETHVYVLSRRRPQAPSDLFHVATKEFAPRLHPGQRLDFSLRANAVQRVVSVRKNFPQLPEHEAERLELRLSGRRTRREQAGEGRPVHRHSSDEKHDVVMMQKLAQRHLPEDERAPEAELVQTAGERWLRRQAAGEGALAGAGFRVLEVQADGYRQHRQERRQGKRLREPMSFSTIEFQGSLEVTDPARMVERLWAGDQPGLGSARGFGCGLMLVRPPSAPRHRDDEDEDDEP